MVNRLELAETINRDVPLFKSHRPYSESDHILNLVYNILAGGTCIEHLEHRRNDGIYLNALGATRIPDPTTAGDFCRRFDPAAIDRLQDMFNETRIKVWQQQPDEFFKEACIDADGTMVTTTGECKKGMDINHKSEWGYHPLMISLANTGERLFLFNRSGNRPSHEGTAAYLDLAVKHCRHACERDYGVVVVWKSLEVHQGQMRLFDDANAFFYITNDRRTSAAKIVTAHANQRCQQENLIEQHKNGVHSLKAPLNNLESNWAYMVIASLAWSLKAWVALPVPAVGRNKEQREKEKRQLLRMEVPTICQAMINVPAQTIRSGRRLIYRLLSWNRWQEVFFRLRFSFAKAASLLSVGTTKPEDVFSGTA